MDDSLPTFEEVVALLRSSKPPVACRVVELRDDVVQRSARVLFDGLEGWFIEDEERVEFRRSHDRVVFDADGELTRLGPGQNVHSNAWVKTPIEGNRMLLDRATGHVIGFEEIDGRRAIIAEFQGLRSGEDTTFELGVDLETGVVLRTSRLDLGLVQRIDGFRVGTIEAFDGS
jgi:hypothetical protein